MLNESLSFGTRGTLPCSSNENKNDVGGPTPMSFIKFASTPVSSTDPAVVVDASDNPTNSLRTTKTRTHPLDTSVGSWKAGLVPLLTPLSLKKGVAVPESSQLEEDENSLKEPRKKMNHTGGGQI
jgi:hypothetical protein